MGRGPAAALPRDRPARVGRRRDLHGSPKHDDLPELLQAASPADVQRELRRPQRLAGPRARPRHHGPGLVQRLHRQLGDRTRARRVRAAAECAAVAERDRRRQAGALRLPERPEPAQARLARELRGGARLPRSAGSLERPRGRQRGRCAECAGPRRRIVRPAAPGRADAARGAALRRRAGRGRSGEGADRRRRSHGPGALSGSVSAVLLPLAVGIAIGVLVAWLYFLTWKGRYTAAIRGDAVQRSQAVTIGKVQEQLIPYLPEFRYNPKDARFLGTPVDLVIFDGLDDGDVRRVVFVEVKTGGATLTGRERQVRDVIEARAVEWAELRVAHR